jgi:hypothetical protein
MKNIIILFIAIFLSATVLAQENTSNKKLTRKEKKELKKKEEEQTKKEVSIVVESRRFVFEAEQIIDRESNTYPANSSINFIKVDSNKAVFQLGSAAVIGVNGLGGITIEGEITNYKVEKNEKNGYYYIVLKVSSRLGFFDIQFDISPLGFTRARITTSDYKKIGYSGQVKSFENSQTYQGITY